MKEGLVLGGVWLWLGPLRRQGSHEVRVGGELGRVLGKLHPRLGLLPLHEVVGDLPPLVVEEDEDGGEQDDDDDDDDDHGLGAGGAPLLVQQRPHQV